MQHNKAEIRAEEKPNKEPLREILHHKSRGTTNFLRDFFKWIQDKACTRHKMDKNPGANRVPCEG